MEEPVITHLVSNPTISFCNAQGKPIPGKYSHSQVIRLIVQVGDMTKEQCQHPNHEAYFEAFLKKQSKFLSLP